MSSVGSWAWAEETNGRLRRRDRVELLRQGMLVRLSMLPVPWRDAVVDDQTSFSIPEQPDSKLAREAEEQVRELSSPQLYGHCLRTWAFAALFAQRDRVEHDPELLYLACILHDLGLTPTHNCKDPDAECFAVEGARAASDLLRRSGESDDRTRTLAEAISLHLNITVPERYGPEAVLLSKGVMLDVVGRRSSQISATATGSVIARWPRRGSSEDLLAGTAQQAKVRPASRAAFLQKLGFTALVSGNPLDR